MFLFDGHHKNKTQLLDLCHVHCPILFSEQRALAWTLRLIHVSPCTSLWQGMQEAVVSTVALILLALLYYANGSVILPRVEVPMERSDHQSMQQHTRSSPLPLCSVAASQDMPLLAPLGNSHLHFSEDGYIIGKYKKFVEKRLKFFV